MAAVIDGKLRSDRLQEDSNRPSRADSRPSGVPPSLSLRTHCKLRIRLPDPVGKRVGGGEVDLMQHGSILDLRLPIFDWERS